MSVTGIRFRSTAAIVASHRLHRRGGTKNEEPLQTPLCVSCGGTHDNVLVSANDVGKSMVEVVLLGPPFGAQPTRQGSVVAHRCAVPFGVPRDQTNACEGQGFVLGRMTTKKRTKSHGVSYDVPMRKYCLLNILGSKSRKEAEGAWLRLKCRAFLLANFVAVVGDGGGGTVAVCVSSAS